MNTHARTHTYVCMYKYIFVSVSGKRDTNHEVFIWAFACYNCAVFGR